MKCPNCKAPLTEEQPECGECGFHLAVVDDWLGNLPAPGPGLVDASQVLSSAQVRAVEETFALLNERFPQVETHALLLNLPRSVDLATTIFWLFNRGGFCPEDARGGNNHHVLLLLDTSHHRAACMVGYGLEPFIDPAALDELARRMRQHLERARPGEALEDAAEHLHELLHKAHARTLRGLGLDGVEQSPAMAGAVAPADRTDAATDPPKQG